MASQRRSPTPSVDIEAEYGRWQNALAARTEAWDNAVDAKSDRVAAEADAKAGDAYQRWLTASEMRRAEILADELRPLRPVGQRARCEKMLAIWDAGEGRRQAVAKARREAIVAFHQVAMAEARLDPGREYATKEEPEEDPELKKLLRRVAHTCGEVEFAAKIQEIGAAYGNEFVQEGAPWKTTGKPRDRARCVVIYALASCGWTASKIAALVGRGERHVVRVLDKRSGH